jgi:uncharacterized alpha-E superfamily protein
MLLSRVADSLYWIGRYLERAEHTARLIDVRLDLGLDRKANADGWDFSSLYSMVKRESEEPAATSPTALSDALVFDPANRHAVLACVTAARENAGQVREEISSDMWEQLNKLFLRLRQARAEGGWSARPHYIFRLVIDGIHLFQGVTDETMGHGEGWQYLQLGRFLERASATAALVDLHFRRESLLPPSHAEFLLLNAEFPRSVRFAAARVESSLRAIAGLTAGGAGGRAERLAGRLHASLDYGQVDEILSEDPHVYLETIAQYCAQIHGAVYQSYVMYPIESALPA